jgi:exodeoxyribonuclease-3
MPQITKFTELMNPDVLCLQETKAIDDLFPTAELSQIGYKYQAFTGMKSYNGVAILSRIPLSNRLVYDHVGKTDCRHISVIIEGIEIHNCYIPAGGDIADRELNEKFGHKLDFLEEITLWGKDSGIGKKSAIILGDFNIAPLEHDVWSHKQLLSVVSHTPVEVKKLKEMQESADWVDAVRKFYPEPQKLYSWWSYRTPNWNESDRGRRLDHLWVTRPLENKVKAATIFRESRSWTQPSDHVPVIVDFE